MDAINKQYNAPHAQEVMKQASCVIKEVIEVQSPYWPVLQEGSFESSASVDELHLALDNLQIAEGPQGEHSKKKS